MTLQSHKEAKTCLSACQSDLSAYCVNNCQYALTLNLENDVLQAAGGNKRALDDFFRCAQNATGSTSYQKCVDEFEASWTRIDFNRVINDSESHLRNYENRLRHDLRQLEGAIEKEADALAHN